MRPKNLFVLLTSALVSLAVACKNEPSTDTPAPAPTQAGSGSAAAPAPSPEPTAAAKLTDPQIAAIVVAANQVDIDAGQLAIKKTKNPEVKKFAEQMITDHAAVNQAAVALVTKLAVTPEPTPTSEGLTRTGAETRANLEKLAGEAFDRAYVDNEVAYHELVIGVLDSTLIPSATNPELEAALVGVKPAFDAHLQHAKQIQAALAGGGSASAAHAHAR